MIQGKVLAPAAPAGRRSPRPSLGQDERSKTQERGVEVVSGDLLDFGR